jgi:hypothetical protein
MVRTSRLTGFQSTLALGKENGLGIAEAKFEQGGFTSGRRKGPKTLFPGLNPENPNWREIRQKLYAMCHRVLEIWTIDLTSTTGNLFWLVCKKRNPLIPAESIWPSRQSAQIS